MECKLHGSNEIVSSKVVEIVEVVDVVDFNLVVLTLFEVVLHIETLDPGWVQVVHDNLSLSNLVPLVPRLSIQDAHSISPRKCI